MKDQLFDELKDSLGEVLGHAAYLCIKHETDPRGVYEKHLDEMKEMLGDILLFNPE